MARRNYSEEFRRQGVDLFESTPGATIKGFAADLGVGRASLRHRVDQYGTGKQATVDGTMVNASTRDRHRDRIGDPGGEDRALSGCLGCSSFRAQHGGDQVLQSMQPGTPPEPPTDTTEPPQPQPSAAGVCSTRKRSALRQ
ncbi:hypothetical protein B2J88_38375 [Rhodococcus sp. SRB_17]|nr:hypothetical protein [Rhodococcus sp. SRB_17]